MKMHVYRDVSFRGSVERVSYMTTNPEGEPRKKYANVYLPYGYDGENREKKYNVLYVMHGGGGNPDAWLDCCKVKNMLDHAIDSGEIEPMIVVFPGFYKEQIPRVGAPNADFEHMRVRQFLPEIPVELLPAVEGKYNTFAENTTMEGLKAARNHRAFCGFSMGACVTWYTFLEYMDYFRDFLPLSGDCWVIAPRGGGDFPAETAKALHDTVAASGYGPEDYRLFTATGSEDKAYPSMLPMIEEMKKYPDTFRFSEDPAQGNFHFEVAEGLDHAYEAVYHYLYSYLPYLFR